MGQIRKLGKGVAFGTPIVAMTALVGVTPAYAGTKTVGQISTTTFTNSNGQNVVCSFRMRAENAPYTNQAKVGYGEFDNVSTDARCALDVTLSASWETPSGGFGQASDNFTDIAKGTSRNEIYAPLHTTAGGHDNQFVLNSFISFHNCMANCSYSMPTLKAKL